MTWAAHFDKAIGIINAVESEYQKSLSLIERKIERIEIGIYTESIKIANSYHLSSPNVNNTTNNRKYRREMFRIFNKSLKEISSIIVGTTDKNTTDAKLLQPSIMSTALDGAFSILSKNTKYIEILDNLKTIFLLDTAHNTINNIAYLLNGFYTSFTSLVISLERKSDSRKKLLEKKYTFNRNILRISTVQQLRLYHRQFTLLSVINDYPDDSERLFRIDIPKEYLTDSLKESSLGAYLWKVKPLKEWVEEANKNGRKHNNFFESVGMFYNDPSYLIYIPPKYASVAMEHGKSLRKKWGIN